MSADDLVLVSAAADYAARQHVGDRRKGRAREPYVNHLAEVADLLAHATEGRDAVLIAAGWLHDTVEDTSTELADLHQRFGSEVAALVAEVTDDRSLPKNERKRKQVASAPHKSERARLIKLADKTSNLRSLVASPPDHWERERMIDYVEWAGQVVAGCRGVSPTLERLFDDAASRARRAVPDRRGEE